MPPRKSTKKAKRNFMRSRRNAALLSGFRKYGRYIKKSGGKRYIKRGLSNKPQRYQNINGVVNQSLCKFANRMTAPVRQMEKLGAPNTLIRSYQYIWGTSTGLQTANSIPHVDVPSLQFLNSNVLGALTPTAPNRFNLDSYQSVMDITNTSTATVEFEIMEIVARRDIAGFNISKNGNTYLGGPYPHIYWAQGSCQIQGVPGTTLPTPNTFVGASPYDTPLFKQFFKIVKRVRVILTQGGSHRHTMLYQTNKLIEQNLLDVTTFGLKGLTRWTMINQRGLPTNITTGTDPSLTVATYAPSQLSICHSQRFRYQYLIDNTTNQFYQGGASQAVAKPNIVNVGSGAVAPIDFAL